MRTREETIIVLIHKELERIIEDGVFKEKSKKQLRLMDVISRVFNIKLAKVCLFITGLIFLTTGSVGYAGSCLPERPEDQAVIEHMKSNLPRFKKIVKEAMKISHVPGLSLAIVYRNNMILVKGFGKKNSRKTNNNDVDQNTVFQVASLSKPFTSTIIASLIGEDGGLSWNSKISTIDPKFSLADPERTALLTIGDLLSHQSGLPDHAGDLLEDLGYSQHEIVNRLANIETLDSFRKAFHYTNFGFSEPSFAIAEQKGVTWDDISQKFFRDLGMQHSSYSHNDYLNSENRADIHIIRNDKVQLNRKGRNPDAQAPAGGLSTTASDASKWLLLLVNKGCYLNRQMIKPSILEEAQENHQDSSQSKSYGYGWNVKAENNKVSQVNHSGAFSMGVRSYVAIDKKNDMGIAIFTNAAMTGVPELLGNVFFKLMNDEPIDDWKADLKKYNDYMKAEDVYNELPAGDVTPPASLSQYTGVYANAFFGDLTVSESQNCHVKTPCLEASITTDTGKKSFELIYKSEGIFYLKTIGEMSTGYSKVSFSTDPESQKKVIIIDAYKQFNKGTFISLY